jgi:DNA-binding beta-propeller fold protein YncE/mono/diheme cytochrome c family protein
MTKTTTLTSAILLIAAAGCRSGNDDTPPAAPSATTSVALPAPASAAPAASAGATPAARGVVPREGSAIARSPESDALYIADEDHQVVRSISLPAEVKPTRAELALPGAPAQVVAVRDHLLVTVRQIGQGGGALLVLERKGLVLKEIGRVDLPVDAWGVSVTPDEKIALVTSAWAHQLSAIDLATNKMLWSVDTAREPRGIAVLPSGDGSGYRAYVSHLVGSDVTRVDFAASGAPTLKRIELPAAPLLSPPNTKLPASLGYVVIASPKGDRAYFPRVALGALGPSNWFGDGGVDVLSTEHDLPRAPPRSARATAHFADLVATHMKEQGGQWLDGANPVMSQHMSIATPRAAVYRRKSDTLLVADEGSDALIELDALAMAPMFVSAQSYSLSKKDDRVLHLPEHGGAPDGIALSEDEDQAYVFCRATYDVMIVKLSPTDGRYTSAPPVAVSLGAPEDKLHAGRAAFYSAHLYDVGGGLACAGCHPEGRDDGHTWHEMTFKNEEHTYTNFLAGSDLSSLESRWGKIEAEGTGGVGYARQTPIIAGRMKASGPYGWHGESATLEARVLAGFGLHGWKSAPGDNKSMAGSFARELVPFLREGLTPPPHVERALTEEEQRGKALFASPATQCATCHLPASDYTDRNAAPLKAFKAPATFSEDPNHAFKTPSLLYVGGSPPYLHDGRFETLEALFEYNQDRMGKTAQLSTDERKALIAFLRTL